MLDQREETRLVVAKSEKEKSQKKLDELRESLEVQFAAKEDAMHHEMLAELVWHSPRVWFSDNICIPVIPPFS